MKHCQVFGMRPLIFMVSFVLFFFFFVGLNRTHRKRIMNNDVQRNTTFILLVFQKLQPNSQQLPTIARCELNFCIKDCSLVAFGETRAASNYAKSKSFTSFICIVLR